jgi:hypothetical protein
MIQTQDIQNSQCSTLQNPQYSQYVRGVAVGALAAGTLAAGALAIHSYVHSAAQIVIPDASNLKEISTGFATTAASTLKAIPTCFANGILNSFTTIASYAVVTQKMGGSFSLNGAEVVIDFGRIKNNHGWESILAVFALTSGASGFASLGLSRLIRLL